MLTEVNYLLKTAFYFMFPLMLQSTIFGDTGKSSAVFGSWHVFQSTTLGHTYNIVLKMFISFFLPPGNTRNLENRKKYKVTKN